MPNRRGVGSTFIVDLGSVKLPDVVEKRIEAEIQAVVLRTLADTDFGASRFSTRLPFTDWIVEFPGQTAGLILNPNGGGPVPLGPQDHTLVIEAVMAYPTQVAEVLQARGEAEPTGQEVLEAALEVDEIDDHVKSRVRAMLEILPELENPENQPDWLDEEVAALERQLQGRSIEEQIRILKSPGTLTSHRDGVAPALAAAAELLEDGADTIYSPDHPFYRMFDDDGPSLQSAAGEIALADAIGAAKGGMGTDVSPGRVATGAAVGSGVAVAKWLWNKMKK